LNALYVRIFTLRDGTWRKDLDAMGANVALLDTPADDKPCLVDALTESPEWVLVYWDDKASLFVREIPEHRRIIRERGLRMIHPLKTDGHLADRWLTAEERAQGLRELERRSREDEPCAGVWRTLSYIYGRMGNPEAVRKALAAVDSYLEMVPQHGPRPRDASLVFRKGQLLELDGRPEQARQCYLRALRIRKGYGPALTRLGVLAEAEKDFETAERYYRRAYRAKPMDLVGAKQYANSLLRREAWRDSARVLRDCLQADKSDRQAWKMLAYCYEMTGEVFRAAQAKERGEEREAEGETP